MEDCTYLKALSAFPNLTPTSLVTSSSLVILVTVVSSYYIYSNCISTLSLGHHNDIILVFCKQTVSHLPVAVVTNVTATLSITCLVTAHIAASSANLDFVISASSSFPLTVQSLTLSCTSQWLQPQNSDPSNKQSLLQNTDWSLTGAIVQTIQIKTHHTLYSSQTNV